VLKKFGKKLGSGLARKLGILEAPATARPKTVQARVLNKVEDVAHGAPLVPKRIVRVLPAPPKEDNWILEIGKP
jgi:hypothetical protein